jgi:tRNA U34 2-thiouridine synthase MnmA/TrmU
VTLLSGGLDSILAIRIMQEQGIEVEALNFKTIFSCCQDQSAQAARELNVPLTVLTQQDDYLQIVKHPRFGYGKGANPCVDCRIYMFERAKVYMEQTGAQFIVSGEVVGQRPMSQKKRDLVAISHHSGLEDVLLRPLSAKLLTPTLPEREGWVDRSKLYEFFGRSRKGLIQLAKQLGVTEIPMPSSGCALTEPLFSKKVYDLIVLEPEASRWQYELLKHGRHFRHSETAKVVVGRNEPENDILQYVHQQKDASSSLALVPEGFQGPVVLLVGEETEAGRRYAEGLMLRYSKVGPTETTATTVERRGRSAETIIAQADARADTALPITKQ